MLGLRLWGQVLPLLQVQWVFTWGDLCVLGTGGGSGYRAEGRVSLRPPRGSDAAAGAAELPAGRVGVEGTAGNCLEQRGWHMGMCDPGGLWVLACWFRECR